MRGLICLASRDRVERLSIERQRLDHATRVSLVPVHQTDLIGAIPWSPVQPATVVRWHRLGVADLPRWKSRAGRPRIAPELRRLIRRIASENPFWGEERIANELLVKLGIRVSPRTVGKYMPKRTPGQPRGDQRWSTFLKNHAKAILACDFFVAVTATFRMLYVFVVIEHRTRRLAHVNVTANPTPTGRCSSCGKSGNGGGHRYLIHDRDRISPSTSTIRSGLWGRSIAITGCESQSERDLRTRDWNNSSRMPGLADSDVRSASARNSQRVGDPLQPRTSSQRVGTRCAGSSGETSSHSEARGRHRLAADALVVVKSIFGSLHHEYSLGTVQSSV